MGFTAYIQLATILYRSRANIYLGLCFI